jgi:hypothetical protein
MSHWGNYTALSADCLVKIRGTKASLLQEFKHKPIDFVSDGLNDVQCHRITAPLVRVQNPHARVESYRKHGYTRLGF